MPLTEVQKFTIIVKSNEGMSIRQIATNMNINPKTVHLWIKRYADNGNLNRQIRNSALRRRFNNQ